MLFICPKYSKAESKCYKHNLLTSFTLRRQQKHPLKVTESEIVNCAAHFEMPQQSNPLSELPVHQGCFVGHELHHLQLEEKYFQLIFKVLSINV